jgi:hypothetical protein
VRAAAVYNLPCIFYVYSKRSDINFGLLYTKLSKDAEPLEIRKSIASGLYEVISIASKSTGNALEFKTSLLNLMSSNELEVQIPLLENLAGIINDFFSPEYQDCIMKVRLNILTNYLRLNFLKKC